MLCLLSLVAHTKGIKQNFVPLSKMEQGQGMYELCQIKSEKQMRQKDKGAKRLISTLPSQTPL